MKTHEFKTEKGDFVAVEYLDNVKQPIAYNYLKVNGIWGNYKLICKLSEATEEDAKGVVDEDNDYGVTLYQNYATTSMAYYDEQLTALDSLHSLLTSKGIDINNGNWYLFKKI